MPRTGLARLLSRPPLGAVAFDVEQTAHTWSRGQASAAVQTVAASGVIQPAGDDLLSQLPEGDRLQETIAVYTATPLRAGGAGQAADCVVWRGARYRVVSARRWQTEGICHALAVRCP